MLLKYNHPPPPPPMPKSELEITSLTQSILQRLLDRKTTPRSKLSGTHRLRIGEFLHPKVVGWVCAVRKNHAEVRHHGIRSIFRLTTQRPRGEFIIPQNCRTSQIAGGKMHRQPLESRISSNPRRQQMKDG